MVKVIFKIKVANITLETTTSPDEALAYTKKYHGARIMTTYQAIPEPAQMSTKRKAMLETYGVIRPTKEGKEQIKNRFADHSITPRFKKGSIV